MKGFILQAVLLFLLCVSFPVRSVAERGNLISHEELAYFSHEDVVGFMANTFSQFIDPTAEPEFFDLAVAFFQNLADQRNITIHKMVYETIDFYGNPVQASGIILIPDHEQFTCTRSFSLYAHGTVFNRQSVNSRPNNWGGEFMLTLMMSAINTICVAPDYYGLGDGDGFHHHNAYRSNVNTSLDCIRAGRNLCDELGVTYNNRILPMGYSEGGHASMGIGRMVREEGLTGEFIIPFLGAGSGAYDMSGEAYNFIIGNPNYITPAYILYQLASCEDIFGNLILEEEGQDISTYLKAPYDQLYEDNILMQTGNIGWVPSYWPSMFHPGWVETVDNDPQHPFRQCLASSNVYQWYNPYPTVMYYCTTDGQVPYTAALKTRDVQRSLIPWYQFWQRFKIQALDLTLGNLIPSHEACALPSIMVQLIFMNFNLGLECTGRSADAELLRTTDKESLDGKVVYAAKTLDFNGFESRRSIKQVEGLNLNTGEPVSLQTGKRTTVTENGMYLFRITHDDGTTSFSWLYKTDPDFVNTNDYDPIAQNPMDRSTILDLSLLDEEIRQIAILDELGNTHLILREGWSEGKVLLERQPTMADGQYTVEVRTDRHQFPLKLEVKRQSESKGNLSLYPNPASRSLTVNMGDCRDRTYDVRIVNAGGVEVYKAGVPSVGCQIDLDISKLPDGLYALDISGPGASMKKSFVKFGN